MTATIIDGKAHALALRTRIATQVAAFRAATGRGVSITPITPRKRCPLRTTMVVRPAATSAWLALST